jgi:predicted transcriptional regulator
MGLRQNILKEPISRLGLREVISVRKRSPVREAVASMRKSHLGCAIVVDAGGKPVGKFTEHLLLKLLMSDPTGLDEPIEKFMYHSADTIREDQPIHDMMKFMQEKSLRYICVTNKKGQAVGLAGHKSLVEFIVDHFPRLVKVQRMGPMVSMAKAEGA